MNNDEILNKIDPDVQLSFDLDGDPETLDTETVVIENGTILVSCEPLELRFIKMTEALKVMAASVRACRVISMYAQQKYGTYVVTGADVHRCDEAVKAALANEIAADAVKE